MAMVGPIFLFPSWNSQEKKKVAEKQPMNLKPRPRKADILTGQLVALIPVEVQVDTGYGSPS